MSKFKIGDKARVVMNPSDSYPWKLSGKMNAYRGKVVTIADYDIEEDYYTIEEDDECYCWGSKWLEPIDKKMLTVSFDPSDKAAAHKMVEEAIKNYYAPKDWTKEEVEQAKDLVCEMTMSLIRNNGGVFFRKGTYDDEIIHCAIYLNSFNSYPDRETKSCPYGNDVFNVWIGKCVALCKALKKPIPDFIRYKNT